MPVRPAALVIFFSVVLPVSHGSGCVLAQTLPQAQTLTDVYQKARLQDPQFRAAQNALAAGLEKLPQARAALLPGANINASKGRQFGDTSFTEAPYIQRDVQSWSWNAQITQPLFRWANWVGWRQAGAQVRQSLLQFALAEQDLLLRSAQAYTDAVLALQSLEVAKNQVKAMAEQLELSERTYAVGTGTITDVQESRAKLALSQAQKVSADNDVEVKNAELEKLLGEPVVLHVSALTKQIQPLQASPAKEVPQLRYWLGELQQNLQVQLQEAALEVAEQETAKNQAGHMPTLDLILGRSASYNSGTLSSPADISTLTVSNSISLQLSVPIYSGGGTESRVREALALKEKAREDLTFAQRNAATQMRQAYAGAVNGQAQVVALQAAVVAGRNAVDSNKIGLKVGTRITPDVLTAEQQLFGSLRDLYKARIDVAIQSLKLKAAVGQLQPEDLRLTDLALAQALVP
jgi:outer membrane protein